MDKFYSVKDASKLLGIKTRTVREWIRLGRLNAIKYNGTNRWFISEKEIQRMVGGYANENESKQYS